MEDWWLALVPMLLLVGLGIWGVIGLLPGGKSRHSRSWIAKQQAPITADLRQEIEHTRWRTHNQDLLWMMGGIAVATPLSVLIFRSDDEVRAYLSMTAMVFLVLLSFVGSGIGSLVSAIRGARGPVRVARAWAPHLNDYVNQPGLMTVRGLVVLVALVCLVAIAVSPWEGTGFDRRESGPLWVTALVAAGCLVAAEVVARRLVDRPLPSGDPLALFWRDSLRAEQVQQIYRLPAILGCMAPVLMSSGIAPWGESIAQHATAVALGAFGALGPLLFLPATLLLQRPPRTVHCQATLTAAQHAYASV